MSEIEIRLGLVEQVAPEERSTRQLAFAYDLVAGKIAGDAELSAAIGVIAEQHTAGPQRICVMGRREPLDEIRWNQGFVDGVQTLLNEISNSVEIQKSRTKFNLNGEHKEQFDA